MRALAYLQCEWHRDLYWEYPLHSLSRKAFVPCTPTSPNFSTQPHTTVGVSLSFSPLYNCHCPDYGTLTFIFQSVGHNICYCSPRWPFRICSPGKGGPVPCYA